MTNNSKPLYIYTTDDTLYIKALDNPPKKLATNIKFYCASVNDDNNINICTVDGRGRITHFFYYKDSWRKHLLGKYFDNIKNIKEIRLYIVKDFFNLFVVQQNPISDNLYRINHFNFNPSNYKVSKYLFKSVHIHNEFIYKLSIDDLSNIVFSYNENHLDNLNYNMNTMLFNYVSRKWIPFNSNPSVDETFFDTNNSIKSIQNDIFDFLYSIKYKF